MESQVHVNHTRPRGAFGRRSVGTSSRERRPSTPFEGSLTNGVRPVLRAGPRTHHDHPEVHRHAQRTAGQSGARNVSAGR